jgi:hypothetical protein
MGTETKPSNENRPDVIVPEEPIAGINLQQPTGYSFTNLPNLNVFRGDMTNLQFQNRFLTDAQDPVDPAQITGTMRGTRPQEEQPQSPVVESRDAMTAIRERNWAWNGVKRDLAKWAAENEGKSMTKGDVTISSSKKNTAGVDAQAGYHFITLKQGDTTIELLVHDASGDIRWDGVTVNGVKVKDFSSEVGETKGKLKAMIDSMKTPAAPAQQNNSDNNPGNDPQNSPTSQNPRDKLKAKLDDGQFVNKILAEVGATKLDALADLASRASKDSKPEEKAIALMTTAFARDLAGSPAFKGGSFSKLGANVEEVMKNFDKLSPTDRKNYYSQWLNAMDDYLRVTNDGHIVIEDDNGKQFMLGEKGGVVPVPKKLEGLIRIPDSESGRMVSFLAVRAMITGHYNTADISGFTAQAK